MSTKKSGLRSRVPKREVKAPKVKSMASIFANEEDLAEFEKEQISEEAEKQTEPVVQDEEEYDDPSKYPFPLNYIYTCQDFLNENLSYSKSVELLANCFLLQVSFVSCQKLGFKTDELYLIGYNLFGTIVGLITSYKAQLKKVEADPESYIKPALPPFNHIYSILLPLYFNIIFKSKFFLLNLCSNYYIIDSFQPFMKVILGGLFFHLFNEDENITILTFLQTAFGYYLISTLLQYISEGNRETIHEVSDEVLAEDSNVDLTQIHGHSSGDNKSLTKPEIHLISVMVVNLFLNLELIKSNNLPLVIFQKLFFVLICSSMFVYPIFSFNKKRKNVIITSIILLMFVGFSYFLITYSLKNVLGENPITWLYEYILDTKVRKELFTLWTITLITIVPIIFALAHKLNLNLKRKIWHFVLLGIITPGLKFEPEFTLLSLLGTLVIFILVEVVRLNKITFVGGWLFDILAKFQDFKDLKGPLNLSYIYLLLGCTLPVLFEYSSTKKITEKSYLGLVTLGVGDSMASIYGRRFGRYKWGNNSKSIDGSLVFTICCIVTLKGLETYALSGPVSNWENLLVTILLSAAIEGASTLNDNLLIPVFSYVSYELMERIFA